MEGTASCPYCQQPFIPYPLGASGPSRAEIRLSSTGLTIAAIMEACSNCGFLFIRAVLPHLPNPPPQP